MRGGKDFPVWADTRFDGNYQAFVSVLSLASVTIRQKLELSGTEIGTVGKWNGLTFEPRFPTLSLFSL